MVEKFSLSGNRKGQERWKGRVLVPVIHVFDLQTDWFVLLIRRRDKSNDKHASDNYSEVKCHGPVKCCAQQSSNEVHLLWAALRAKKQQTSKNIAAKNIEMLPAHRQDVPNQECLLGFFQRFALS